MQQNLNLINPVPVPIWAELGPAQPQLVPIFYIVYIVFILICAAHITRIHLILLLDNAHSTFIYILRGSGADDKSLIRGSVWDRNKLGLKYSKL